MSQEVTARLEAVAARLEAVAAKLGRGRGGGGGDDDDDEVPEYVAEYEAFVNGKVKALADALKAIELNDVATNLMSSFQVSLTVVQRAPKSKKPTNDEFKKLVYDPIEQMARAATKKAYGRKGYADQKVNDMCKKMEQLIRIPLWVMHSAPAMTPIQHIKDFCQGDVETAIGGGIRNNSNDAQKKQFQSLLQGFKGMVDELQKFIKNAGFKTGVEWNPKGGSIMDAKGASGGGAAAEEKKEEAPKKKPAKKAAGGGGGAGGGMAAVFGDLSKGLDVTKGMKKVTKDMKTKNRADRSGKVTTAPQKRGKKKRNKSGQPDVAFRGGRWFVENFDEDTGADKKDGNGVVQVEKANLKSNVFITMCDDTYVQIKEKVKAVTIDNCVKTTVYVTEVVSTVELVNSKSVKIIVMEGGRVPSFAVDKCESPQIILSKSAFAANPDIYSSNVSAMNVEYPGLTENDNNRECPVPEQFLTKIDPKTGAVTTTPTEH
mmetsp:Transcript_20807/g.33174  ORF Transcript_20807/g.33174 Transcript_20807/m.33174 type:complete len:487 (-) Transcript_20807:229-1689(-)